MSLAFGQAAGKAGIAPMGSHEDCFDNAVAENFFAALKKELIHHHSWTGREDRAGSLRLHRDLLQRQPPALHPSNASHPPGMKRDIRSNN